MPPFVVAVVVRACTLVVPLVVALVMLLRG
jgi:hypothetical protein